jgi:hypothetical protein
MTKNTPRGGSKGNHTGYWSHEAHRLEAKRLYMDGLSANEVAKALARTFPERDGPTANAVIGLMWRLGVTSADRKTATRSAMKKVARIGPIPKPKREASPTRATIAARSKALKPEPIPMSKPVLLSGQEKVWTERKFGECNWIVAGEGADSLACCAKVHARGWCAFHYERGTLKPEPAPRRKRSVREPTFYDVEAA